VDNPMTRITTFSVVRLTKSQNQKAKYSQLEENAINLVIKTTNTSRIEAIQALQSANKYKEK
jgi:NACalpha-BTF3-like transcription factor